VSQSKGRMYDSTYGKVLELGKPAQLFFGTRHIQRLRGLAQLGEVQFIRPTVSHSRLAHSLGVAHLAKMMIKSLMSKNPNLLPDKTVDLLEIAGLCHDLGHGPFSHLFERILHSNNIKWTHEEQTLILFDHCISEYNLDKILLEKHSITKDDLFFIKCLILGDKNAFYSESNAQNPFRKDFLFEIIANKYTGLDMDRWDYFLRDGKLLSSLEPLNYQNLIKNADIVEDNDALHIGYDISVIHEVIRAFHMRQILYSSFYTTLEKENIVYMLLDGFNIANKYLKFGSLSIFEAIKDPNAFLQLNDTIYHTILQSDDPRMEPAVKIFKRLEVLDFYQTIIEKPFEKEFDIENFKLKNSLIIEKHDLIVNLFDRTKLFEIHQQFSNLVFTGFTPKPAECLPDIKWTLKSANFPELKFTKDCENKHTCLCIYSRSKLSEIEIESLAKSFSYE